MHNKPYILNLVGNFLPPKSKILILHEPFNTPAILTPDLDGDGCHEIIVGYKWHGQKYVTVLKNINNSWRPIANLRGDWYQITSYWYYIANLNTERNIALYPASLKTIKGTKWGYINNQGNFEIQPKYDSAMNFQSNDLAIVGMGDLFGIINSHGDYIVAPKYGSINEFCEGRSIVVDKNGFNIINESGKLLTSKAYSYIGSFHDGRALFSDSGKDNSYLYGYLDIDGNIAIPLKYQSANDFIDGKALVKINENQFALINLNGELLFSYKYPYVGPYGDGFLVYKETLDGKSGYIDESGKVILPIQYPTAQAFNEGIAIVNMSDEVINKYGVIDKKGNFILKPLYNSVNSIGSKRLAVGKAIDEKRPYVGSKYSISDTSGNFLTDFVYTNVTSYKNGLATACNSKNIFFIDISGKPVNTLPILAGCGTLLLLGDLIQANVDNRLSYLNKAGEIVWQQNNNIPLNNLYSIIEKKYKPNKDYLVYYPQLTGIKLIEVETTINNRLKELSQVKPIDSNVQLDYSYTGDFSVEFFNNTLAVLKLEGYKFPFGAAHGMPSNVYPHIDLVSGVFYELKDLFKKDSNYVKVLSDIIANEIKTNEEYSYVFPGAFNGIQPNQPFYIDENNLYIYFNPYEIAPYAAGFPTFKIPFTQISSIIDTNGSFWKAKENISKWQH